MILQGKQAKLIFLINCNYKAIPPLVLIYIKSNIVYKALIQNIRTYNNHYLVKNIETKNVFNLLQFTCNIGGTTILKICYPTSAL